MQKKDEGPRQDGGEKIEDQQVDRRGFLRYLAYGVGATAVTAGGVAVGIKVYLDSQKPPALEDIREAERPAFLTKQTMDLVTEMVKGRFALMDQADGARADTVRGLLKDGRAGLDDAPPIVDKKAIAELLDGFLQKDRHGRDLVDHFYGWLVSLDLDRNQSVSTEEIKQVSQRGPSQQQLLTRELEAFLTKNWETARTLVAIARIVRKETYELPNDKERSETGGKLLEAIQGMLPKPRKDE